MLLAIDAGNTNIVFAVCTGGEVRAQWRAATATPRTADEYAVMLGPLLALEGLTLPDLNAAIISTVVPAALFDLRQFCRRYLKCEPLLVKDPNLDLGLGINVDRPQSVGADRLVNTFDVVGADGAYDGGVIAPGVNLSAEALHQAAAMLPRVAIQRTQNVIGKDTVPAMQSGLFWGYIGLIETIVAKIKEEIGQPMTVIATGGLANLFYKQTPVIEHLDPDLNIRGLMLIHARNAR